MNDTVRNDGPPIASPADSFPITPRNRVRRKPDRGRFDKATVYDIMDGAMVAHIAYVIDGQPYCTPTGFWREGDRLYWHGSTASRMIRAQAKGLPVCVTATHLDAIVLARSGFHHSVNYRSVMAYGTTRLVDDPAEKAAALDGFVDRFFPGRSREIRKATEQEAKATTFIAMEMVEASGKIRATHVADDEADYALPVWAARIPVAQILGDADPCPRQLPGIPVPPSMQIYRPGRRLD
ncbi:MAG: pyridoxamine 5'-phosphate oxidase family protein, partial [Rhodospirillales bacterium]|nr:pyridoxamine 5'-phosphate oxidase family protein [Rhodospirillales bacterium]